MTASNWSSLPLLPLKCVLEHLSLSDVLAATAACRNWRYGLTLYEGKRETLKLSAKDVQKSLFLTKTFRKNARRLQIHLDCSGEDLDNFFQNVLPIYYEPSRLSEIVFVTPGFMSAEQTSTVRLRSPITENLMQAHRGTLHSLALFGCEMSSLKDDIDEKELPSCDDKYFESAKPSLLLPQYNMRALVFSSLRHLSVDFDSLDSVALDGMSTLPCLQRLSFTITAATRALRPLPWATWVPREVAPTIIGVSTDRFPEIMEHILTDDIPVVAIRVMFCKVLHEPLIKHITARYSSILQEFQWVDAPHCGPKPLEPIVDPDEFEDPCVINPFILVCWRCTNLRKLVIHGYWIWQYDLLGMVRLRHSSLQQLEVSAIFCKEARSGCSSAHCLMPAGVRRVVKGERARPKDESLIRQIHRYLKFPWRPTKRFSSLHPALGSNSTDKAQAEYVLQQVLLSRYGVT